MTRNVVEGGNFIYGEMKLLYHNWRQVLSKTLMVAKFNDHCDLVSRLFSIFQQTEATTVSSVCIFLKLDCVLLSYIN